MFRIQIRQTYLKEPLYYGSAEKLEDIHSVMTIMESEWAQWYYSGMPKLSPDNPIQFLEGADICVVSDSGLVYIVGDDCQFHIMN